MCQLSIYLCQWVYVAVYMQFVCVNYICVFVSVGLCVYVWLYICNALAPVLGCLSQIKQLPVGRATVRTCAAPAKRVPPSLKEEETGKVS